MPSLIWAAEDVGETQRFDYYRAALCASFVKLSPEKPTHARPFNAHLRLFETGRHAFTFLTLPDHLVRRTERDISDAGDESLYVNFVLSGHMRHAQGGERISTPVGGAVVVDNARPFDAHIGAGKGAQLLVCKAARSLSTEGSEAMTARMNRHPLFPAFVHLMQHAARNQLYWDDEDIGTTGVAVNALLRAMTRTNEEATPRSLCADTLQRTRVIVRAEIADADLSIDDVARELKLTRRTLQVRLAQCGTTFTEIVTDERCMAVDRLRLQLPDLTISEISRRVGYTDPSTFYRAYQRKNGRPPSREA